MRNSYIYKVNYTIDSTDEDKVYYCIASNESEASDNFYIDMIMDEGEDGNDREDITINGFVEGEFVDMNNDTFLNVTVDRWESAVAMMDDEIRERVHGELAPCTNAEFLTRYIDLDPGFVETLNENF